MDFKIVIPVIISFVISVILAPVIIPFLRRLKASQTERTDGVKSHLSKAGTPTMGGLIFLIAVTVTSLFYVKDYPKIIPILFLTLGFGLIGFLDDYLKVVLKRSDGLLPAQKMAGQIVVTAIFAFYLIRFTDDTAGTVQPWLLLEHRLGGSTAVICSGDRYGKRCKLYRRTGRSCIQRDRDGCNILYGCGSGNTKRY